METKGEEEGDLRARWGHQRRHWAYQSREISLLGIRRCIRTRTNWFVDILPHLAFQIRNLLDVMWLLSRERLVLERRCADLH
jgi:hypothetical protein